MCYLRRNVLIQNKVNKDPLESNAPRSQILSSCIDNPMDQELVHSTLCCHQSQIRWGGSKSFGGDNLLWLRCPCCITKPRVDLFSL